MDFHVKNESKSHPSNNDLDGFLMDSYYTCSVSTSHGVIRLL
jgi:hypothetical protein